MPCPKWEETVVPLAMGVSLALRSDLPAMANQIRAFGLRQINPTGKSPKVCPAPREKILRFCRRGWARTRHFRELMYHSVYDESCIQDRREPEPGEPASCTH